MPVDFLREIHDDCQDDKESDTSGEQGVGFQLNQEEYIGVQAHEQSPDGECRFLDFQDSDHVERDQRGGGKSGDQVCPREADMFRGGNQQRVEQAECQSDQ